MEDFKDFGDFEDMADFDDFEGFADCEDFDDFQNWHSDAPPLVRKPFRNQSEPVRN